MSSKNTVPAAPAAPAAPAGFDSGTSRIYLGLDVHKDSVTIAVLPEGAPAPTHLERLPNDFAKLRRFMDRLIKTGAKAGGDQIEIQSCYEASGAGYVLQRSMREWGYSCEVIAPSLIPIRPGVKRKHDKHDAAQLARLYRAGELTVIHLPTEAEERVRDLVRCRETFQREIMKSRHYILKFLARRGLVYRGGVNWRPPHLAWLKQLASKAPSSSPSSSPLVAEDLLVYREYLSLLEYKLSRREELDRKIEALALTPSLAPVVQRLQCFRGISVHSAMVLATELTDWRRFEHPGQLAAYLGLVPTEHSSGDRERKGAITKAGNSHCRHVLVQAAWSYRHRPQLGTQLKARQKGQPVSVVAHSWKAQHRLHKRYTHLVYRKPPQIAVVAVARELVGFLWSAMRDVQDMQDTTLSVA